MSSIELVPGPNPLLEMQMLGTCISAVAYGILVMLSFDCLRLLYKDKGAVQSKPMRRFLFVFIVVMFLLCTLSLVQGILVTSTSIFRGSGEFPSLPDGAPFSLSFVIWGSDGFMLWRCAVLYQGISRSSRIGLHFLMTLVGLATLCKFPSYVIIETFLSWYHQGSGILLFMKVLSERIPALFIVSATTFLNLTITSLITARLVRHQIYLHNVLGPGYGSPYKRFNAVIVESASLIMLVSVPYIFLVAFERPECMVFLLLFPQICAISPLLIIYRVAQGRAATGISSGVDAGGRPMAISAPIHFHTVHTFPSMSSISNIGESDSSAKAKGQV